MTQPAPVTVPLGGGGALAAVLQGRAVLPFGGAEMGGGHGGGVGGETAVQQQGGQRQALRHSGTGAIQPEEGDVLPPDGEAGANALVEQVAEAYDYVIIDTPLCRWPMMLLCSRKEGPELLLVAGLGVTERNCSGRPGAN